MIETKPKIEYRMLAGPALEPLIRKMVSQDEPIPNLALTIAFVAEDDQGEILAYCMLQSLPVAEPTHAEPGYGEHLRPLFEKMKEFVLQSGAVRVLSHTSHPAMKAMLKQAGAVTMEDEFFDWRRER